MLVTSYRWNNNQICYKVVLTSLLQSRYKNIVDNIAFINATIVFKQLYNKSGSPIKLVNKLAAACSEPVDNLGKALHE